MTNRNKIIKNLFRLVIPAVWQQTQAGIQTYYPQRTFHEMAQKDLAENMEENHKCIFQKTDGN